LKELARQFLAQVDGELRVPGLQKDVQVVRDQWGVPHIYGNLLPIWADNQYFPMVYSRQAVEASAAHRLKLMPAGR
jgi:hypothetical protein